MSEALPNSTSDVTLLTSLGLAAREKARDFAAESLSPATLRAYRSDWADFASWAAAAGVQAMPAAPPDVAAYLASLAETHAPATIRRRLACLSWAHRTAGHDEWRPDDRAIAATLRGLLRTHGRPADRAAPIGMDLVRLLVATCQDDARGTRDRAMLLLGFAGALRRSEITGLRIEQVRVGANDLRLALIGTKTDQTRAGQSITIPAGKHVETCPVTAFRAWRALLPERSGPVFRAISKADRVLARQLWPDAVRFILRCRVEAAGLDLAELGRISPHGLRAGFVTAAFDAGLRESEIMPHTRHRNRDTLRSYDRPDRAAASAIADLLGL